MRIGNMSGDLIVCMTFTWLLIILGRSESTAKHGTRHDLFCRTKDLKFTLNNSELTVTNTSRKCAYRALAKDFKAFSYEKMTHSCLLHPISHIWGQGAVVPSESWSYYPSCMLLPNDWRRTVVLVEWSTVVGEHIFIQGGIPAARRHGCDTASKALEDPCALPLSHSHFPADPEYDAWATGDTLLDSWGPEDSQGIYAGHVPSGSPLRWSTNDSSDNTYHPENKYGPHYWVLDVQMDCSRSDRGWFEFEALFLLEGSGVVANDTGSTARPACTPADHGESPYISLRHSAACGFTNVFFKDGSCMILTLP